MGNDPVQYLAFTTKSPCVVKRLCNIAGIGSNGHQISVPALWDTGATGTCISHEVVKNLSLIPTGQKNVHTPNGESTVDTYMVDVFLPNHVTIRDVEVCDSEIGAQGIGILIGMDIISLGDFAVSNYDGKTVFTFRTPSKQVTDYVKQITAANAIGQPHGVGKRKRKK